MTMKEVQILFSLLFIFFYFCCCYQCCSCCCCCDVRRISIEICNSIFALSRKIQGESVSRKKGGGTGICLTLRLFSMRIATPHSMKAEQTPDETHKNILNKKKLNRYADFASIIIVAINVFFSSLFSVLFLCAIYAWFDCTNSLIKYTPCVRYKIGKVGRI